MSKYAIIVISCLLVAACEERKETLTVACIGDSITEGYGIERQCDNAYPALLDSILGPGYSVMNFGRSGTTMMRRGDYSYWTVKEMRNALNSHADIVVIKLGTNDCKAYQWDADEYETSYQALIDTLLAGDHKGTPLQAEAGGRKGEAETDAPRIYLCLPVPVMADKWTMSDSVIAGGVIPAIKRIAERNQLPVIDLYTPFVGRMELFSDSIHPTRQGALLMAETIAQEINKK